MTRGLIRFHDAGQSHLITFSCYDRRRYLTTCFGKWESCRLNPSGRREIGNRQPAEPDNAYFCTQVNAQPRRVNLGHSCRFLL